MLFEGDKDRGFWIEQRVMTKNQIGARRKAAAQGKKNASNFYYPRTCTALHFRRNPQSKIVHEAAVDLSRGQAEEREELKERKIKRQIRRMVSAVDDSPSGSRRKGRRTP